MAMTAAWGVKQVARVGPAARTREMTSSCGDSACPVAHVSLHSHHAARGDARLESPSYYGDSYYGDSLLLGIVSIHSSTPEPSTPVVTAIGALTKVHGSLMASMDGASAERCHPKTCGHVAWTSAAGHARLGGRQIVIFDDDMIN